MKQLSPELQKAFELFTPPFRYDRHFQHIVDSEGNQILDVRGWGRLCRTENGDKIQDAYGEYFANLINEDLEKNYGLGKNST